MNKEEYIAKNLTRWDRFKANFLFVPAAVLALGIILLLLEIIPWEAQGFIVLLFLVTAIVAVFLRVSVVRKIDRLSIDFYDLESTKNMYSDYEQ